jgi:methyl-accepting chemotaxis protein
MSFHSSLLGLEELLKEGYQMSAEDCQLWHKLANDYVKHSHAERKALPGSDEASAKEAKAGGDAKPAADAPAKAGESTVEAHRLVQSSWAILVDSVAPFADRFYELLFEEHPVLKQTVFKKTNFKVQSKMLMSMIGTAVDNLDKPDVLVPALKQMGLRHCRYGTKLEHYGPVGGALVATLAETLGSNFTPKVKESWITVYGVIQDVMGAECKTEAGEKAIAAYYAKNPVPAQ